MIYRIYRRRIIHHCKQKDSLIGAWLEAVDSSVRVSIKKSHGDDNFADSFISRQNQLLFCDVPPLSDFLDKLDSVFNIGQNPLDLVSRVILYEKLFQTKSDWMLHFM